MPAKIFFRSFEGSHDIREMMNSIGVNPAGIDAMTAKGKFYTFRLKEIDPRAANIIKQEFLAKGGEAAIAYHCLTDMGKCSDVLLMATEKQYSRIVKKLEKQPFGLGEIAEQLAAAIQNLQPREIRTLKCGQRDIKIGEKTQIMGVLNVTPDSFSDGGQFADAEKAIARGIQMVNEGADIVDVGGESTRPGARPVNAEEELKRVIPVIEGLAAELDVPISIDTTKYTVAAAAINAGAGIINDVSALENEEMRKLAAEKGVPVILMHMQGDPRTMQESPRYDDVVDDIIEYLAGRIALAEGSGISRDNLIIDPGIGFGKTIEHNLEIVRRLGEFRILGQPVMLGASRKSFIGGLSGSGVDDRLEGSLASTVIGAFNGADIVRVHDVRETKLALSVADKIFR